MAVFAIKEEVNEKFNFVNPNKKFLNGTEMEDSKSGLIKKR